MLELGIFWLYQLKELFNNIVIEMYIIIEVIIEGDTLKFLRFYITNERINNVDNIKTGYFNDEKIIELADPIEIALNNWQNKEYIENNIVASYFLDDVFFISPYKPF